MMAGTESNEWVKIDYQGRVAIITIDRPEKLNALPKDGFYRLSECLREVDTHDEVSITILIGTGRFFSAYVYFCPPVLRSDIAGTDIPF